MNARLPAALIRVGSGPLTRRFPGARNLPRHRNLTAGCPQGRGPRVHGARSNNVHLSFLSEELPVGHGNLFLSNRGRVERGRQGRVDLGSLRPHARPHHRRQQRRRGLRPLPSLAGRRGPDDVARPASLPLFHRLAAHPARRPRPGQSGRVGLLQPPGGWPAGGRHPAVRHALPLGLAPGVAGRRRLAGSGHGRGLRGIRRRGQRRPRRPRAELDHPQRALVRQLPEPPTRRARPGLAGYLRRVARRPPRAAVPWLGRAGHPRQQPRGRGRHHPQPRLGRSRLRQRGRPQRGAQSRRQLQPLVPRPRLWPDVSGRRRCRLRGQPA